MLTINGPQYLALLHLFILEASFVTLLESNFIRSSNL